MTKSDVGGSHNDGSRISFWKRRNLVIFGIPLTGAVLFFIFGIVFWGGFNTVMEATNTLAFCTSCHEVENTVYKEYKKTIHFRNRTGIRATCSDCHVPDPWVHKFLRKIAATNELYHKLIGSVNTPEKFEAKRLDLAKRVWKTMKETDSRECRNCHDFQSMDAAVQRPRARKQQLNAFENGQTCIDCHKGIAHKQVRDLLAEDELEALEKPAPALLRQNIQAFRSGIEQAAVKEAAEAQQQKADTAKAKSAIQQRIEAAVEAAVAEAKREAAAAPAASDSGAAVGADIDWNGIETNTVTLFYPGQASFEWALTGKDHGGARAFTKGGDRCSECHLREVKDMGARIVSGKTAESTPIPDKRPAIDVQLQAAHDGEKLYLRLRWLDTEHVPIPFVDGGKMDEENQTKFAMMIAGSGIKYVEQAGCWVTCHHDSRYMPHAPDQAAITAAGDLVERLGLTEGVTKYLAESRTKVEVKGRRGKKRGGWNKPKSDEEIEALAGSHAIMDLIRYRSGGAAENGHVLENRSMQDGVPVEASGKLEGNTWTVVLSRPLISDAPGDLSIQPGKTYTVGFAIHDDYTSARFHHVSLEYRLALDDPKAEINVVRK